MIVRVRRKRCALVTKKNPETQKKTDAQKKTFEPLDQKLLANIPKELKALRQWVCWKLVSDVDGKPTKRPILAQTGSFASTTNPDHWSSYDEAVSNYERYSALGIGFVFTKDDPYCGIDLDTCRDKTTGEFANWAQHIIDQFDTYGEISPSGTGIKMIVRGKLPGAGNRRGCVELYEWGRFFTITGNCSGTPKPIAERQAQLDALYHEHIAIRPASEYQAEPPSVDEEELRAIRAIPDNQLLRIASSAANGKKFKDLWGGSTAAYADDDSAADLALCSILAFYTGRDHARIDKLFRKSGLIRKKWDERHGSLTYGEKTIAKACASTRTTYDPKMLLDELNDATNAEIFIELNSDQLVYCSAWKSWLIWDQTHWNYHTGIEYSRAYVATANVQKYLLDRAAEEQDDKRRAKMWKWGVTSGDKYKKDAMLHIATQRMDLPPSIFDRDPMLIATKNGVVDLRHENFSNPFREARREDFITRCAGVNYDKSSKCPIFDKFLAEVMENDEQMISYLWRVIGYALTGDIRERVFFILHGTGRNGKTTFLETLMAIAGTYAQKARFSSFLKKKTGDAGPRDDIAHMVGARKQKKEAR
jgi:putative DNA primase/helicase